MAVNNIRLLQFLVSTMLTWHEKRETKVSTSIDDTRAVRSVPAPSEVPSTLSTEVEYLLLKALRTSELRMLAMEAISSCENIGSDAQRIALLQALVEASVAGADLDAVSGATSALSVTPEHAGKLLQELLQDRDVIASVVSAFRELPYLPRGCGS